MDVWIIFQINKFYMVQIHGLHLVFLRNNIATRTASLFTCKATYHPRISHNLLKT